MASTTEIPREALEWLTGPEPTSVLIIGSSDQYASQLAYRGHTVTAVDPDGKALMALASRRPWIRVVAAKAESLPFDPGCFSMVLSIQNFHTFSPSLALGEWARVLKPHGWIGLAYLVRDDSVPWVRKLRRIVQAYLPEAMTSDQGVSSVSVLADSTYFPGATTISFRLWVPSSRTELQNSARSAPGANQLSSEQLTTMLDEIGQLYDEYARIPEPLLLPYRILCWRASVDRAELSASWLREDTGVSIAL